MPFDHKDDLRLQMVDLENKLTESEEERMKLEKTCNALMKALKEEEKMRYKMLNKKYEKFLQDCARRKKRNEIILKSLSRIEDRSRALFAKTERLKLLKDRYISYLKIGDVKKDEVSSRVIFPSSSSSQKTTNDVSPKSVQWKTPLATDSKSKKPEENFLTSRNTSDVISGLSSYGLFTNYEKYLNKTEEIQEAEGGKQSGIAELNETYNDAPVTTSVAQNKLNLDKTDSDYNGLLTNSISIEIKSEELVNIIGKKKSDSVSKLNVSNGAVESKKLADVSGSAVAHRDSIGDVRKVISYDDENHDKKQNPTMSSRMNRSFVTLQSTVSTNDETKYENLANEEVSSEGSPKKGTSLPMGLDGVDYQDETYPESYYEQPVHHHNHTSIAADVILEEDETEADGEEEEKDITPDFRNQPFGDGHSSSSRERSPEYNEPADKEADLPDEPFNEIKSQELGSERSSEAKRSGDSRSDASNTAISEKSGKSKPPVKSNLLNLLESDSESFQIEHGEAGSGNEGSDFDFSFH